jgi:PAS domain S-box-containing protein
VVVIATEAHREAFASQLLKQGVSVLEAARRSSYVALDADQALSEFMVDGQPNWGLFSDFIGGILRQATLDGAGARAFGEMVALLATRGNADAALRLEAFWNDLAKHHRFSLLCAYPMSAFRGQAQTETFLHICQEHSCSVPAESFSLAAPLEERLESISLLQQKAGSFAIERAERLQAESESRAEKAKVDLAVAAADLGIWEMDMDTKAVHCSHRCKGHFGIAGEAAVTFARLFELIHPEDRPRVQMELETAETKGSEFSVEYRVVEPSGTQRWLSTRGSSFRNGANRMVGVTQDITERKRATELLERTVAERTLRLKETIDELEAFSYSVSHDMRAPLRAINAYAHVLLTDYGQKLDLEAVACLERIERGATRLDMLVRDVLAYSKVAKGQIELRGIALRPLLEDIIHQQPEFEARKECIAMEDSLPIVRGHEACLTQCITNLIHNAFKFVAPGVRPLIDLGLQMVLAPA